MQLNTDGSMVANIPVNQGITAANLAPSVLNGIFSSGDIKMSGTVSPPAGWLLCDGTSYLIATYPALAAALFDSGTGFYAYGSADSTHFNVPDMRGMFPRGTDSSGVNDPDFTSRTATAGGNSAGNVGSLQPYQIQSHTHSQVIVTQSPGALTGFLGGAAPAGPSENIGFTGGNQTNPVNVYVNFFIKT
jgi:microcystin-dependent protein